MRKVKQVMKQFTILSVIFLVSFAYGQPRSDSNPVTNLYDDSTQINEKTLHIISEDSFSVENILFGWSQPIDPSEGMKVIVYFNNGIGYYRFESSQWKLVKFSGGETIRFFSPDYETLRNNPGSDFCESITVKDFEYSLENVNYIVKGGIFKKSPPLQDNGATVIVSNVDSTSWKRIETVEVLPDWWENLKDSKRIQAAVNFAGNGGKVVFLNREYIIDDEIFLDTLQNVHFDGRKATLKAADGIHRNATLAAPYSEGSYQIQVNAVPSSWEKGDILVMVSDPSNIGTSGRSQIDSISGNTVFLKYQFTSQFGGTFPSQPVGTSVIKSLYIIRGAPSTDEAVFGFAGFNKGTIIENFVFNGNKQSDNEVSLSWSVNTLIQLNGRGSEIRSCKFVNTPSEVISGHGINVHDNVFEDCNGSVYHLSAHDDTFEHSFPAYFINNTVINCNTTPYALSGHNEGIISFSWNGGYLIVNGNYLISGASPTGVIGTLVGYQQGPNYREIVILTNNYCKGFNTIVNGSNSISTRSLLITGNIFEDCDGLMQSLVNSPDVKICGNVQVGSTDFGIDFRNNCDYRDMVDRSLGYGKNSLLNTGMFNNTAFGHYSLENNTEGNFNVAIGESSGRNNVSGNRNTYLGTWAGINTQSGDDNTVLGFWSRSTGNSGDKNVHIGAEAGRINSGSGNIFIGYAAGRWMQGDNQLIIHNDDSNTPLIQGDFGTKYLNINGSLSIEGNNLFRLPRLTTTQRDDLTPLQGGEMIFNTTIGKLQAFDGSMWIDLN